MQKALDSLNQPLLKHAHPPTHYWQAFSFSYISTSADTPPSSPWPTITRIRALTASIIQALIASLRAFSNLLVSTFRYLLHRRRLLHLGRQLRLCRSGQHVMHGIEPWREGKLGRGDTSVSVNILSLPARMCRALCGSLDCICA